MKKNFKCSRVKPCGKNSFLRYLICSSIIGFCLTGCGDNPEKDGKEVAQLYCDCRKEYLKAQEKTERDFLSVFDSYGFKTRSDARRQWREQTEAISRTFHDCNEAAEQKAKALMAKYPANIHSLLDPALIQKAAKNPEKFAKQFQSNQEKASKFENARNDAVKSCEAQPDENKNYPAVEAKIVNIQPSAPSEDNLKQSLVGRRIVEQANGYFGRGWAWRIGSPDDVKEIMINASEKTGKDYALDVRLVLQRGDASRYEAEVKIICIIGQGDDWKVDFIETKYIRIVKTGRYDNCVNTEVKKSRAAHLQFTNNCDVNLIVGGQVSSNNEEWTKFSCNVSANGNGSYNIGNTQQYKIDFIERQ